MAKTIITIGREYCTGGNYIAEDVANALGIKLYDKELITMAAKHSGLSEEAVAASEKRRTHSLLYSLYTMGKKKHYNLKKTSRFLAVGFWIIAISCVPVLISLWFDAPWICIICVILLVLGKSVIHDYASGGKLK